MLVLSRKKMENIQIGEDIVIKIIDVRNGSVRIGITAPRGLGIRRLATHSRHAPAFVLPPAFAPAGPADAVDLEFWESDGGTCHQA